MPRKPDFEECEKPLKAGDFGEMNYAHSSVNCVNTFGFATSIDVGLPLLEVLEGGAVLAAAAARLSAPEPKSIRLSREIDVFWCAGDTNQRQQLTQQTADQAPVFGTEVTVFKACDQGFDLRWVSRIWWLVFAHRGGILSTSAAFVKRFHTSALVSRYVAEWTQSFVEAVTDCTLF